MDLESMNGRDNGGLNKILWDSRNLCYHLARKKKTSHKFMWFILSKGTVWKITVFPYSGQFHNNINSLKKKKRKKEKFGHIFVFELEKSRFLRTRTAPVRTDH